MEKVTRLIKHYRCITSKQEERELCFRLAVMKCLENYCFCLLVFIVLQDEKKTANQKLRIYFKSRYKEFNNL